MLKQLASLGLLMALLSVLPSTSEALSRKDFESQAKYYGVTLNSDKPFDTKALDGIVLPYTKVKIYIEHNEQFTKPILDALVDAVSESVDYDLYNTQYEMEGLVETYKDYYKASADTANKHTKHFAYNKLGTDEMNLLAKAANADFILYADVVPLYAPKKASKDELDENGIYDYYDINYYHGGDYKISKKKQTIIGHSKKLEVNLRLRVFNTKKGLFTYVNTQRLVGTSHNTSNNERAIRHSIWRFATHENNPKTDSFFRHRSDKLRIILQ